MIGVVIGVVVGVVGSFNALMDVLGFVDSIVVDFQVDDLYHVG